MKSAFSWARAYRKQCSLVAAYSREGKCGRAVSDVFLFSSGFKVSSLTSRRCSFLASYLYSIAVYSVSHIRLIGILTLAHMDKPFLVASSYAIWGQVLPSLTRSVCLAVPDWRLRSTAFRHQVRVKCALFAFADCLDILLRLLPLVKFLSAFNGPFVGAIA